MQDSEARREKDRERKKKTKRQACQGLPHDERHA
jgi:hypothetical protein